MSSESFDAVHIQAIVQQPEQAQVIEAVGREMPPAPVEQVRATDAVFSRQEESAGASLVGAWAAGLLVHEIIGDHLKKEKPDEEEEPERGKKQPHDGDEK